MSFAAPVTPAERGRPTAVTVAGYLLYLVAALLVIRSILPLPSLGKATDAIRQVYTNAKTTPDQAATFLKAETIGSVVIYIVVAVGIALLAAFDLRGKQVARIITWVIGGLGVLCVGCGVILAGRITSSAGGTSTSGEPDPQAVTDALKKAQPSWLTPTSNVLSVIMVLALIVVIILLALPVANAFFKPAQVQYVDPGYPAYPPVPGAAVPPASGEPAPPAEQVPSAEQPPAEESPGGQRPTPPADQPPAS